MHAKLNKYSTIKWMRETITQDEAEASFIQASKCMGAERYKKATEAM